MHLVMFTKSLGVVKVAPFWTKKTVWLCVGRAIKELAIIQNWLLI
jgi:hypothetical protein